MTVICYIVDFIGYYTKEWTYNTKNGHSHWTGVGWGLVAFVAIQSRDISYTSALIFLSLAAIIIFTKLKKIPIKGSKLLLLSILSLLVIFILPRLFILSFSLDVWLESIGVDTFHYWRYKKLKTSNYILPGVVYAYLIFLCVIIVDILNGEFVIRNIMTTSAVTLFGTYYITSSLGFVPIPETFKNFARKMQ